jgi:hypothetical protein
MRPFLLSLVIFPLAVGPRSFAAEGPRQPARTHGGPIRLHPENPHYFLFRGKPTVLITSTEHYGAVLNGDFEAIPYLDELHARGFNLTRTFSGTYREVPGSFKIRKNTLAPTPETYIAPWPRTETPGAADGPKSSTSAAGTTRISSGSRRSWPPPPGATSSSSTRCSARSTRRTSGR